MRYRLATAPRIIAGSFGALALWGAYLTGRAIIEAAARLATGGLAPW